MNRSLLVFSILLILLGLSLGAYIISILGFFLLFPALLSTPRTRPPSVPTGSGQQAPEPAPVMEPAAVAETAPEPAPAMGTISDRVPGWGTLSTPVAPRTVAPTPMPPLPPSQPSFSAPLFPTSIFPSTSQQMPTAQALKGTRGESPAPRDEVLELGGLLALMKLIFG